MITHRFTSFRRAPIYILFAVCVFSAGCGSFRAPVIPPTGGIYTLIEAPMDLNSQGGKQIGPLKGEAVCKAIMGIWAVGDAGLEAAARNGGITRINHVDYRYRKVFYGFVTEFTTIAYGE